jgi:hypothetical protein
MRDSSRACSFLSAWASGLRRGVPRRPKITTETTMTSPFHAGGCPRKPSTRWGSRLQGALLFFPCDMFLAGCNFPLLVLSRLDNCNSCRSYFWRFWMSVRTKIPSRDGHACHGGWARRDMGQSGYLVSSYPRARSSVCFLQFPALFPAKAMLSMGYALLVSLGPVTYHM